MFKFISTYRNSRTLIQRSLTFEFDVPSYCIIAGGFNLNDLWANVLYQSLKHLEPHEVLTGIQILREENNHE